eukprot:TRINITY_DN56000_c0_g1_i1.p1 TRINITY_DN56000_c0_g1~~TRINITY_DN56000_c0_g1_i1.p1  ORF type:complete len:278 (-),score=57.34 TRINITY_DN56000_c0_g1_i1:6-839(-)
MSLHSTLTLVVLGLGLSSSLRDIRTSKPLEEDDFYLGKTLDIRSDLVDLYPGTGGPMSPPEEVRNSHNQTRGVFAIWPNGLIPYWMDSSFSDNDRAMIANAFAYIQDNTCLRFEPDTDDKNPRMDIISDNLGGYCYTSWQTDGREDTYAEVHLTPSSSCTVPRTIVHELMHGVSFYHTHKREDRDLYVRIEWDNISPSQTEEFEYCSGCCCNTRGVDYDCSSVMHYAKDQMSRNGKDTITPLSDSCNIPDFSEWNYYEPIMSNTDVEAVQIQYGEFC